MSAEGPVRDERDAPRRERVGSYEILGLLGEGGVGVVYRARHLDTGEVVALKTVRVRASAHASSIRREILALHRLRHPGIVRVLDGGVFEERPWYAMELLEGPTLLEAIGTSTYDASTMPLGSLGRRSSRPPPSSSNPSRLIRPAAGGNLEAVLTLFRLLCAPLAYLHGEGTVHRDIKPSNVFVRSDGTPVLTDFGLVGRWRGALGREILEETQTFGGTLSYMAPEQIRGEMGDARSDLYSLGCTLYEALTGMVPFEDLLGDESPDAGGRVALVPPSDIVSGVPPALDELLRKLLAKEPRERLGHADDVAQALAALGARDWPSRSLPRARAYLYQPRLVGRKAALDALLEGVDSSKKLGGLLLLGGESGIGKTALAAEVARIAYRREHEVITSECPSPAGEGGQLERAPPLKPFRPLLRHILEYCRIHGQPAVERIVGRWRALLGSIEPGFLELGVPPSQRVAPALPVQAALERMLAALSDTIVAFARESTPVLLVVDDLQWADGLSLALLTRLGTIESEEIAGRLVVLATYRTEEGGPWLESLMELPRTLHVELEPLDADDVGHMVADMLGIAEPPPVLAAFLGHASEGNPFFVGEYLRAALDAGQLYRDNTGRWQRDDRAIGDGAFPLPGTIRALVERRLAALSPVARALVGVAALIGREVEPDLLALMAERHLPNRGLSERDLAELVSELTARHVLGETERGTLVFRHETLRQAAYDGIPAAECVRLHGRVASALEVLGDGTKNADLAADLGRHHLAAGNFRRAVDYLELAGTLALSRSAHGDAARLFEEALRVDESERLGLSQTRRAALHARAGQALQGVGNLAASEQHLSTGAKLFGWPASPSPWGLAAQIATQTLRQVWHRLVGTGTQKAPRAGLLLDAARTYDCLLQIHYFGGDRAALVHAMLMTLNLAERAGPSPELASAYANTFAALSLSPALRSAAQSYLLRAQDTLAKNPDPAVESYLLLLHGVKLASDGAWTDSEPNIRRAIAIAERLGYRRRWEEGMAILAYNHALRGAFNDAIGEAEAVERSASRGDNQTRCWSLLVHAQAKLGLGQAADACEELLAAARIAQTLGRDERVWAGGILAAAELARGDPVRAARAADETLLTIGKELPVVSASGEAYAAIADVCLELCRRGAGSGERLRTALEACRALERVARAFPLLEPRALLCRGDALRLLGRERRARSTFARCIQAARRCHLERVAVLAEERLQPG